MSVPKTSRKELLYFLLLAMLVSLFLSRTTLAVSMIIFITVSIMHTGFKHQLLNFLRSPLLWGMSLLFFIPLVSGLWSGNQSGWWSIMVTKAPLLFMPLAFARPFRFSQQRWKSVGILLITLVVAATAWSFFQYITNYSLINEGYLKGRSFPTFLENDRVRFSWLVAVSIFICSLLAYHATNRTERIIFVLTGIWLIVFLHLLSVRTGLISFYIVMVAVLIWLIRRRKIYAVFILGAACLLPVAAYFLIPSFQNRVKYFRYELPYFKKLAYTPGGNDVTRVISIKGGWDIMNEHPLSGTGLGDLDKEMKKWYDSHYPGMWPRDKIAPSSEWLIYGVAVGWPGFLVFTLVMLIPFFLPERKNLSWIAISIVVAFSFLFDIGLEVQFGVFVYSFVVLCWWKWLHEKEPGGRRPRAPKRSGGARLVADASKLWRRLAAGAQETKSQEPNKFEE